MKTDSPALTVLICPDGDQWFAQGVDVNYAACGDSVQDVQRRFERGFTSMIFEHFRQGTLETFLSRSTPQDVIDRLGCDARTFTVYMRDISAKSEVEGLPFNEYWFMTPASEQIEAS